MGVEYVWLELLVYKVTETNALTETNFVIVSN